MNIKERLKEMDFEPKSKQVDGLRNDITPNTRI